MAELDKTIDIEFGLMKNGFGKYSTLELGTGEIRLGKIAFFKNSFEKITVKMITDGADVIRPTFYKHFQDKYEIIEYILEKEIKDKIQVLIENDMEDDLLRLLFTCLSKDKEFYKKLYLIEGANSFDNLMFQFIYDTLLRLLNKYPLKSPAKLQILSRETIARFYTFGLADSVKYAIMHDITYTPEEIAAAYDYLIHNSAFDLVEHPRI